MIQFYKLSCLFLLYTTCENEKTGVRIPGQRPGIWLAIVRASSFNLPAPARCLSLCFEERNSYRLPCQVPPSKRRE